VAADTKAEAKAMLTVEFDKVVEGQPTHAAERDAAQAAAEAFVDVLSDPVEGQSIVVNVHGSLGWLTEGEFVSANVGIAARVGAKV